MVLLIWSLPLGSEATCCDVKEVYHIAPLSKEQLAGTVVHLQANDSSAVNTCNLYSLKSAGIVYSDLADGGIEISGVRELAPSQNGLTTVFYVSQVCIRCGIQHPAILCCCMCQNTRWLSTH